jgi:hypothetical protein
MNQSTIDDTTRLRATCEIKANLNYPRAPETVIIAPQKSKDPVVCKLDGVITCQIGEKEVTPPTKITKDANADDRATFLLACIKAGK